MSKKAQVGVMVAVGGMIFGLMISPIPNVASEYVLGSVINQMDYHMSRQEAALDGVQMTSDWYFPNFYPTESFVENKIQNSHCNSTTVPGGNRIVKLDDDISSGVGCRFTYSGGTTTYSYSSYQTGNTIRQQKAEMGYPPKISFYPADENPHTEKRPNSVLLSVQGGVN